jgi:hypothetical protein
LSHFVISESLILEEATRRVNFSKAAFLLKNNTILSQKQYGAGASSTFIAINERMVVNG